MATPRKLLIAALSTGLAFSPLSAQAQQTTKINETSTPAYGVPQQSGGAAGSEAGTSTGGAFGLSTMTLVGIGVALAAIVVAVATNGTPSKPFKKEEPTCENGGIADCGWVGPPRTTASTNTSTTSTGTGS